MACAAYEHRCMVRAWAWAWYVHVHMHGMGEEEHQVVRRTRRCAVDLENDPTRGRGGGRVLKTLGVGAHAVDAPWPVRLEERDLCCAAAEYKHVGAAAAADQLGQAACVEPRGCSGEREREHSHPLVAMPASGIAPKRGDAEPRACRTRFTAKFGGVAARGGMGI